MKSVFNRLCLWRRLAPSLSFMTLPELEDGRIARVIAVNGGDTVSKRLMEMGVVPGVRVRMVKSAPFGDPIEISIRGYNLAVRRHEARAVEVESPDAVGGVGAE